MCAVAENALILARHLLHRNFSFYKITDITVFSDKKTEPQFCIKITVLLWVQGRDLNPRPPGYEPDELPNCSTLRYLIGAGDRDRTGTGL